MSVMDSYRLKEVEYLVFSLEHEEFEHEEEDSAIPSATSFEFIIHFPQFRLSPYAYSYSGIETLAAAADTRSLGNIPRRRNQSIPSQILRFFSPNLSQTDNLLGGQFFAAVRLVVNVESGQDVGRTSAFVQAYPSSLPISRPSLPPKAQAQPVLPTSLMASKSGMSTTSSHQVALAGNTSTSSSHNPFKTSPFQFISFIGPLRYQDRHPSFLQNMSWCKPPPPNPPNLSLSAMSTDAKLGETDWSSFSPLDDKESSGSIEYSRSREYTVWWRPWLWHRFLPTWPGSRPFLNISPFSLSSPHDTVSSNPSLSDMLALSSNSNYNNSSSSVLEVEYFEEVGACLGPTSGFYALGRRYGGQKRTCGQAIRSQGTSGIAELVLGEEVPLTIETLKLVNCDLANSLMKLFTIAASDSRKSLHQLTVEDPALDFTLLGYHIELKPSGRTSP
ncbi:MAG: hypothetical protein NXY57DRAFT_1042538 [Lentinula lateritia]|nr:MAG: hypothetical protein NXY57DRAFT_1042538 [Lentinula lateritia]